MKKISLFATDLDGTLLRNDGSFSKRDLGALASLRENGCAVVLATGRSPFSLKRCLGGNTLPVDWFVLSSGACVYNSAGEMTYSRNLLPSDTAFIHGEFARLGITDISIQGALPDAHFLYWMEGNHCLDFKKRIAYYKAFSKTVTCTEIASTEVIGFVPPDQAEIVIAGLSTALGNKYSIVRATSPIDHKTVWIEVFAKGVCKSAACDLIRKHLDIPLQLTAAIGNDWNDVNMLRWAHRSFISENAPQSLLKEFQGVPSNQQNAVSAAAQIWQEEEL